jgi:hypothetical protein
LKGGVCGWSRFLSGTTELEHLFRGGVMMRVNVKVAILTLVTAASLVSTAGSGLAAPPGEGGTGAQDTIGDHPLTTSFKLRGRIGVTVSGLPYDTVANPSGVFNVSGVPSGSRIVKALLYLTDWNTGTSASAIFAGAPLGPAAPLTTDPGGGRNLGAYRFDVTTRVTGNGVYDYTSSGIGQTFGSALVVVYSNGSLLGNKIWINDGAENMCCEVRSETHYTRGPSRPRSGGLIVFTEADDNVGREESGEVISLNGRAVGGPIDGNLGPYASLFDLAAPGIVQTNTVAIDTHGDWFGWHLAILSKRKQ